jgi:hypothetical protein
MAQAVAESIEIAATPAQVYDLVADVARMGEWSPEATGSRGAPAELAVGDKFWGKNRRGFVAWTTRCTVLVAQPGSEFVFNVDAAGQGISRWKYEFVETDLGCVVTESWVDRRGGVLGLPIKLFGQVVIPGDRAEHNRRNILITLQSLKRTAEAIA